MIEKQRIINFQLALASSVLTDVLPSSAISSFVCLANGDETEIAYVITTSLMHKNRNAFGNLLTIFRDGWFMVRASLKCQNGRQA